MTNAGVTNSANRVGFVNSNIQSSGFGLRGQEDLGSGLSAIFNLKNIVVPSNGKLSESNEIFGQMAFVGLSSKSYGTLTLGRQYDPVTDLLEPLTADIRYGALFTTVANVDNYDALLHINSSVKYASPVLGGFQFEGMASLNGVAGSASAGSVYSAALAYTNGGLALAGGYIVNRVYNTLAGAGGAVNSSTTADGLNYDNPVVQFANIRSNQIARFGGQYTYGKVIVGAAYSNSKFNQFDSALTLTFNSGSAFLLYNLNPELNVAAGYTYTKASGDGANASYNQLSLGSDYFFSLRTDVYLSAVYQRANGETLDNSGGLVAATASIGDEGFYGTSRSQAMAVLGIRHRF